VLKLGLEDLPKPWRAPLTLAAFAGAVILTYLAIVAGIRNLARAEAREVERDTRTTFKAEALEAARSAAREGAEKAVREAVAPFTLELAKHLAAEEERLRLEGVGRPRR
jgi:hypothetical protein